MSKHWRWPTIQASYNVAKLVPKLKFYVRDKPQRLRNVEGPLGRLKIMRKTVTALFKSERIELNYPKAAEVRGQAERLIVEAIRNGPCHRPTMELADFWLEEKQLVHKLFKVFVPRYRNYDNSFTRLHFAPRICPGNTYTRAILELRGNPFPSVVPEENRKRNKFLIHNILLSEARREFRDESLLSEKQNFPFSGGGKGDTENLSEKFDKLDLDGRRMEEDLSKP